jgi:dipeptidyl-peptidase 4
MKNAIVFAMLLVSFNALAQKEITLSDIFEKGTFAGEGVAGFRSMNDGLHYVETNSKQQIEKHSFKDGSLVGIIADLASLQYNGDTVAVEDYTFDAAEKQLLITNGSEAIYRRSFVNNAYVYDLATKTVLPVSTNKVMHASFSPNGKSVAYVYENNLYIFDIATKTTKQVTTDGKRNAIINGNCDWVYEEEFGFSTAYKWNKDGAYLAYYKFDESAVKEFSFTQYGTLYPKNYDYKYPKAGEDNSKVSVHIYELATTKNTKVSVGDESDIYLPRIHWSAFNNNLFVYKLNRLQNNLEVYKSEASSGKTMIEYVESNARYIDINDDVIFLTQQDAFIYTSEKKGYNHIYLHNCVNHSDIQITGGNYDVLSVKGIDEKNKLVYFISTFSSPLEKKLFSVKLDEPKLNCITQEAGVHNISFGAGFKYFMDAYSKVNTPPIYTIRDAKGKVIRTLKSNEKLAARLTEYNTMPQELIKVRAANDEELNAWIIKPANINDGKKHPVLMFQYSGPGSQQVSNSWMGRDYWWYQMLAQKGYVIACVDGRGTGCRGEEFKKCTYKQLGKLESDDQIAVAKYFGTLPYIDKDRIGIWGWSYGGYMSSICLMKGADVFKSAIAVAPVTNWRYYDNIYTERYMQKPQNNAAGYDDNSPINMVKKLKGNYLLVHGTADDNVHFSNSVEMVNALVKANKEFDFEMYPDKNHGISGGVTRYHLYKRLTQFILEKL